MKTSAMSNPLCARFAIGALALLAIASPAFPGDWTTFGHDPQRTGWAADEPGLNPKTVGSLHLQWVSPVKNQSVSLSALTAPVGITGVRTPEGERSIVFVAGVNGNVVGLDARTGEEVWSRQLRTVITPRKGGLQGTFVCPGGITATPVIDKRAGILYVIAASGELYGLDVASGQVRYGPVQFVAPFAKSWSLNLVDGKVYTTVSLGCGNGRSGIYEIDVRDKHRPSVRQALLSNGFAAGIWGRGGAVIGEHGKIYGGTADGDTNPAGGDYSSTIVAVSQQDLSIADYFLPPNWTYLKRRDLDVGSTSPVWFRWNNRNLLAHGSKEGVIYLMDADHLGGADHQTPLLTSVRLGNDGETCCEGAGIWGSLAMRRDGEGQIWIYVPMGGPPAAQGAKFPISNGANSHGSIMAFKVVDGQATGHPILDPAWISGDFNLPDPPVIANGVLFALSNGENPNQRGEEFRRFQNTRPAVLKALDANTGKELYNSGGAIASWAHFSALAIVDGRVFAVDHASNVYCFGTGTMTTRNSPELRRTASIVPTVNTSDAVSQSWIGMVDRQDEIYKSWVKRTAFGVGLALLAALVGISAGVKNRLT